ncbi:MAG: hypothetical protein AB7O96_15735, partial [Pseudobdellovibrionaceae bacterium]
MYWGIFGLPATMAGRRAAQDGHTFEACRELLCSKQNHAHPKTKSPLSQEGLIKYQIIIKLY